jgi:hypothetical protein
MLSDCVRKQAPLVIFLLGLLSGTILAQRFDQSLLDAAIEKKAKEIPANSLSLPEVPEIGAPPASVSQAGAEFVEAWKLYRTVTARRPRNPEAPSPGDGGGDRINAYKEWEKFEDLLRRTVDAEPPPDISEYGRFTYSSLDWCGDGAMTFSSRYQNGLALAMLRNGKPFDALQLIGPAKAELLLPAFGVDPETFRIGEWLAKQSLPDHICKTGKDKSARMLMDWADIHFDSELERRRIQRETNRYETPEDEPYFPRTDIIQLLRPDNGVTDETKTRIVDHIKRKGIILTPLGNWFYSLPKGSEKWMIPIARLGLDDPLNRVRKRSSAILTAAGVEHAPPALHPDPRFKILVNGEKWPGRLGEHARLRLSIDAENAGTACGFKDFRDGIATCDADKFIENGEVKSAQVYVYPYIWGRIRLPIDYGNVGTVSIEARELTISPVFPDRATAPEDRTYAVELDRFEEGRKTDGSVSRRTVKNHEPYVYPNVSPGEYWLRVRHPGAVLEDRQRITIKNDGEVIRPRLRQGSSLVIPIDWPEVSDPGKLPPELGRCFVGFGSDWHGSLHTVVTIKGDGVRKDQEYVATPEAAEGRFPNSVIFPYLPPGKYTVEVPARTIEPRGIHPGCVIRPSSIEVEILNDSPSFVVTKPLKVLYTEKR